MTKKYNSTQNNRHHQKKKNILRRISTCRENIHKTRKKIDIFHFLRDNIYVEKRMFVINKFLFEFGDLIILKKKVFSIFLQK